MIWLKPFPIRALIGTTILYVVYHHSKRQLIFVLNNNLEVMIHAPNISLDRLFTKNRYFVEFRKIINIPIKDIGWDINNYLFIVDEYSDVYRVQSVDMEPSIYNYTLYKTEKSQAKENREMLKKKVKSLFSHRDYINI